VVVARRQVAEHRRRATERAQEVAVRHAEAPAVALGLDASATDRPLPDCTERYRAELAVRARARFDGQLRVRIPPVHAPTTLGPLRKIGCRTYDPRVLAIAPSVPVLLAAASAANAGDLTGNMPWGVWLLIPLALGLALLTSLALGSGAEPRRSSRRAGGVGRALRASPPPGSD
jgi:hypothetical protein